MLFSVAGLLLQVDAVECAAAWRVLCQFTQPGKTLTLPKTSGPGSGTTTCNGGCSTANVAASTGTVTPAFPLAACARATKDQ